MVAITKETISGHLKEKTQESVLQIEEKVMIKSASSTSKRERNLIRDASITLAIIMTIITVTWAFWVTQTWRHSSSPHRDLDTENLLNSVKDEDRSDGRQAFIPPYVLSDAFINDINSKVSTWQAGRNFHESTPLAYIKSLVPAEVGPSREDLLEELAAERPTFPHDQPIPDDFDARTEWPQCKSLWEIRDQGSCGSCWAVSSVQVMTDRQCIHKNEMFHYSTEDLMACCQYCGFGCNGGSSYDAFCWWRDWGIVSGGPYGSDQGCMPYLLKPCEHHINGSRTPCGDNYNPSCHVGCVASYNLTYNKDLHYAKTAYTHNNESEILVELFTKGPMVSSFFVYEDFLHYKSGVYHHVTGGTLGVHVVKVFGYGVEGSVPYYLCANSWNYDWGNGGFFKIRRDQLSNLMITGIPK